MSWYIEVLKKYWVFSGTATRSEYWWFSLIYFLVLALLAALGIGCMVIYIVFAKITTQTNEYLLVSLFLLPTYLYMIVTFPPVIGVQLRRLHDIGFSEWWFLIALIPQIGYIVSIAYAGSASFDQYISYANYIGCGILTILSMLPSKLEKNKYRIEK